MFSMIQEPEKAYKDKRSRTERTRTRTYRTIFHVFPCVLAFGAKIHKRKTKTGPVCPVSFARACVCVCVCLRAPQYSPWPELKEPSRNTKGRFFRTT